MGAGFHVPDLEDRLRLQLWMIQVHSIGISHTGVITRIQRVDWCILERLNVAVAVPVIQNGEFQFHESTAKTNLVGIFALLTHFYSKYFQIDHIVHMNRFIIVHTRRSTAMISHGGRMGSCSRVTKTHDEKAVGCCVYGPSASVSR